MTGGEYHILQWLGLHVYESRYMGGHLHEVVCAARHKASHRRPWGLATGEAAAGNCGSPRHSQCP